jgi:hypothetical protein
MWAVTSCRWLAPVNWLTSRTGATRTCVPIAAMIAGNTRRHALRQTAPGVATESAVGHVFETLRFAHDHAMRRVPHLYVDYSVRRNTDNVSDIIQVRRH